jgi:hypothetical protein
MRYDLFQAPSVEPKHSNIDDDELNEVMDSYEMTDSDREILRDRGYVSFGGTTLVLHEAADKETA